MKKNTESDQFRKTVRGRKVRNDFSKFTDNELIEKGKEFAAMCEAVSDYAGKQDMKPEILVKEIFYSALLYKEFLDKYLP